MSRWTALFDGLPPPTTGKLTLYALGPGIGESLVVSLPDGKWLVMDTCMQGDVTLPLALLEHFQARAIDLLVISHPDRDHYRGLPQIVSSLEVKLLWRYRGFHQRRPLLAKLCELDPGNKQLSDLREAEEAMGQISKEHRSHEVAIDAMEWPRSGAPYQVSCIAPCPGDFLHQTEELAKLFKLGPEGIKLAPAAERFLLGKAGGVDGKGNPLSLAIVIRWGGVGVLLGGDLEAPLDTRRGWRGVLAALAQQWPKSLDLLRDLTLVKLSHHGSFGAFCREAWSLHTERAPAELAIVTPFRGGGSSPPQRETFRALKGLVRAVALTSAPISGATMADPWERLTGEGWTRVPHPQGPGTAPCVAVVLDAASPPSVTVSMPSAAFETFRC